MFSKRLYINQIKKSPLYLIQLDESIDIAGLTQLSVFMHYINNAAISEDFLFCKALKLHTNGEDIFQCLNSFFSEYSIPWDNCAGICTDGAAACTSFRSGAVNESKKRHQMLNGPIVFSTEWPLQQKIISRTARNIKFCCKMREFD